MPLLREAMWSIQTLGMPRSSTGSSPSRAADGFEVLGEPQQPRVRLAQRLQVARVEVVVPAIEVEADAVVEQRPPAGAVDLPLASRAASRS